MSLSYRNEFQNAKSTGNWSKAESLISDLIDLTEVEDAEYQAKQVKMGSDLAERMNKNDALAKNLAKGIKII